MTNVHLNEIKMVMHFQTFLNVFKSIMQKTGKDFSAWNRPHRIYMLQVQVLIALDSIM